jgi:hypothetical protein
MRRAGLQGQAFKRALREAGTTASTLSLCQRSQALFCVRSLYVLKFGFDPRPCCSNLALSKGPVVPQTRHVLSTSQHRGCGSPFSAGISTCFRDNLLRWRPETVCTLVEVPLYCMQNSSSAISPRHAREPLIHPGASCCGLPLIGRFFQEKMPLSMSLRSMHLLICHLACFDSVCLEYCLPSLEDVMFCCCSLAT